MLRRPPSPFADPPPALSRDGGLADCTGSIVYSLAELLTSVAGASPLVPGNTIHFMAWGRDPLDAFGTLLPDALALTLTP